MLAEHFELVLLERAGFALEGHFASLLPRHDRAESGHEPIELRGAEIGRRAAAEVDVIERPAADARCLAQQFDFFKERVEIDLDVLGVLVGIDPEIAELAALAAE